ncbi:MAG: hypothetical protein SOS24_03340 [Clostridia bacterium]|nr:hypothetical protein [Clostridia bacterium]
MNYLRRKYMALMRGVNFRGYLRKVSGYPLTLTDCMDSDIVSLSVAGNAVQDGTPSPDAPVEVVGVGDKTEPYGYRVPIECDTGDTVNIYTDKPLYGIDDYTDSITLDFEKKKAVRTDKTREIILSTMGVYRKCENVIRFAIALSSYKGARMMCNGLKCLAEGKQAFTGNFECLFMHTDLNTRCYFSLNKTRIGAEDTDTDSQLIEKANAYLADNPITAYYKLGIPIETDISDTIDWDSLSLHLQKSTNILTSTATVKPTGMTAEYYSSKEV